MWQKTRSLLALESSSFTLQNCFPPVSGEHNDYNKVDDGDDDDDFVDDNDNDDNVDDGDGVSRDDGPCFGIEHIYKDELL